MLVRVEIELSTSFEMLEGSTREDVKKEVFKDLKVPSWVEVESLRITKEEGDVEYEI